MDRRLPYILRIKYKEENEQIQKQMPTKLKYLMRPETRRDKDGNPLQEWAHAVLLPHKDKPVLVEHRRTIEVGHD